MLTKTEEQLSNQIIDDYLSMDVRNMTAWEIYVAGFAKGGEVALDL